MDKLELIEKLRQLDELTLLEILEITSDDIVDAFLDHIVENESRIYRYFNDE